MRRFLFCFYEVNLYLSVVEKVEHRLTVLKLLQLVSLNKEVAAITIKNIQQFSHFVSQMKQTDNIEIQTGSFQMVSSFY